MKQSIAQNIAEQALSFVDVPFKQSGRSYNGIDCVGLVVLSLQQAGIDVEDFVKYTENDHFELLIDKIMKSKATIVFSSKQSPPEKEAAALDKSIDYTGCVVVFRDFNVYNHVGIIIDNKMTFVHAYSSTSVNKVIKQNMTSMWFKRIHSIWQPKELKQ